MTSQHIGTTAEALIILCFWRSGSYHKLPKIQVPLVISIIKKMLLWLNKKQLVIAFTIGMISFIGDKNLENQTNDLAAAICDNVTHVLIGIFTWVGTFINKTFNNDLYFILEVLLCGIFSSIVDVDHFITAKSVKLKDAISLKSRPFMHCTTLVIIIIFTVLLLSYLLNTNWLFKFGWILAAAFLSHHIRDSKRRGFWIWPLGHTAPTPFLIHMPAQMLFPYILSMIISRFSPPEIPKTEPLRIVESV